MNEKLRVAITHGDINGISYEVILKALEDSRLVELCTPVVYGSAKIAQFYRKGMELLPVNFNQITSADDIKDGLFNIINVIGEDVRPEPGQSTESAGKAAFEALERAVEDLRDNKVDILVTAPINKHSIQSESFTFPGHTEFLESVLGDEKSKALMILCTERLRVALATTHLPINKVADNITVESLLEKLTLFSRSLHQDFGIHHPRIAVLSLNPHAGDDGLLGDEEKNIIIPAIEAAQENKIVVFGPYAADGFFGSGAYKKFDGVLAMYHDQGLTPFKTIAMENGVNFTAGLPFVRTSPDHGTGYDIAGKGVADASSMRNAIYMAIDIYRNRLRDENAHRHPLKKQYHEKSNNDAYVAGLDSTED